MLIYCECRLGRLKILQRDRDPTTIPSRQDEKTIQILKKDDHRAIAHVWVAIPQEKNNSAEKENQKEKWFDVTPTPIDSKHLRLVECSDYTLQKNAILC